MAYYEKIMKNNGEFYKTLKSREDTVVVNEGTDEEFLFANVNALDSFIITAVSRLDFESRGYDASGLTEEELNRIADHMGDNYVGYGSFWDDIDYWAEEYGLEHIKKEEDAE